MPKLLLDENLSPATVRFLKEELHLEVQGVREVELAGATDEELYAFAAREGYLLMTYNADFARAYRWGKELRGLILLRVHPQTLEHLHPVLRTFFSRVDLARLEGAISVVETTRYRIRRVS